MDSEERPYREMFKHYACCSRTVTLTRRFNKYKGNKVWSHTNIWIPAECHILPLPFSTPQPGTRKRGLRGSSIQFFGVHRCLTMTIQRPPIVDNVLRIAECLPSTQCLGDITWIGTVQIMHSFSRAKSHSCTGWRIGIPTLYWQPPSDLFHTRTSAAMIVHTQRSAVSSAEFQMLTFPAISRRLFDRPLLEERPHR